MHGQVPEDLMWQVIYAVCAFGALAPSRFVCEQAAPQYLEAQHVGAVVAAAPVPQYERNRVEQ